MSTHTKVAFQSPKGSRKPSIDALACSTDASPSRSLLPEFQDVAASDSSPVPRENPALKRSFSKDSSCPEEVIASGLSGFGDGMRSHAASSPACSTIALLPSTTPASCSDAASTSESAVCVSFDRPHVGSPSSTHTSDVPVVGSACSPAGAESAAVECVGSSPQWSSAAAHKHRRAHPAVKGPWQREEGAKSDSKLMSLQRSKSPLRLESTATAAPRSGPGAKLRGYVGVGNKAVTGAHATVARPSPSPSRAQTKSAATSVASPLLPSSSTSAAAGRSLLPSGAEQRSQTAADSRARSRARHASASPVRRHPQAHAQSQAQTRAHALPGRQQSMETASVESTENNVTPAPASSPPLPLPAARTAEVRTRTVSHAAPRAQVLTRKPATAPAPAPAHRPSVPVDASELDSATASAPPHAWQASQSSSQPLLENRTTAPVAAPREAAVTASCVDLDAVAAAADAAAPVVGAGPAAGRGVGADNGPESTAGAAAGAAAAGAAAGPGAGADHSLAGHSRMTQNPKHVAAGKQLAVAARAQQRAPRPQLLAPLGQRAAAATRVPRDRPLLAGPTAAAAAAGRKRSPTRAPAPALASAAAAAALATRKPGSRDAARAPAPAPEACVYVYPPVSIPAIDVELVMKRNAEADAREREQQRRYEEEQLALQEEQARQLREQQEHEHQLQRLYLLHQEERFSAPHQLLLADYAAAGFGDVGDPGLHPHMHMQMQMQMYSPSDLSSLDYESGYAPSSRHTCQPCYPKAHALLEPEQETQTQTEAHAHAKQCEESPSRDADADADSDAGGGAYADSGRDLALALWDTWAWAARQQHAHTHPERSLNPELQARQRHQIVWPQQQQQHPQHGSSSLLRGLGSRAAEALQVDPSARPRAAAPSGFPLDGDADASLEEEFAEFLRWRAAQRRAGPASAAAAAASGSPAPAPIVDASLSSCASSSEPAFASVLDHERAMPPAASAAAFSASPASAAAALAAPLSFGRDAHEQQRLRLESQQRLWEQSREVFATQQRQLEERFRRLHDPESRSVSALHCPPAASSHAPFACAANPPRLSPSHLSSSPSSSLPSSSDTRAPAPGRPSPCASSPPRTDSLPWAPAPPSARRPAANPPIASSHPGSMLPAQCGAATVVRSRREPCPKACATGHVHADRFGAGVRGEGLLDREDGNDENSIPHPLSLASARSALSAASQPQPPSQRSLSSSTASPLRPVSGCSGDSQAGAAAFVHVATAPTVARDCR